MIIQTQDSSWYKQFSSNKNYIQLVNPLFFDESRLPLEWTKVQEKLRLIVLYAAGYSTIVLDEPLLITHIYRTQAEQDEIYKNDPKYKLNKFQSVHQFYRGVDASLRPIGVEAAKKMADHINAIFPYAEGSKLNTVLVHDVGHGNHIHFQCKA